jgi:hypothetical protein
MDGLMKGNRLPAIVTQQSRYFVEKSRFKKFDKSYLHHYRLIKDSE